MELEEEKIYSTFQVHKVQIFVESRAEHGSQQKSGSIQARSAVSCEYLLILLMKRNRAIALLTFASLALTAWASAATAQTVNISHLQTNLQAAVCVNDWPGALRAIAPLIGSPGISSAYRQELIQFRHQLEDWRAAQSEFANMPGCDGAVRVTTSPSSTGSGQALDWYRAVQSLEESRSTSPESLRLGF